MESVGGQARSYDAGGNLQTDGEFGYIFGADGKLAKVSGASATVENAYNGLGERAKKTTNGAVVYFAQVGAMVTGEYTGTRTDGTGNAVAEQETVFLNGLPMVALTPGGNVFVNPGPQGEPYAVITESGQNVWQWKHAPFGDTPPVGSMEYNLRFPGQYADKETGLSYNNNRFLDPRIGGYASPDPIGLNGGMNPYDYVNGDPGKSL